MAGGEKRSSGRAAPPEAGAAMASLRLPCVATGVSLRAVWGLSGVTPWGQPWPSAVPFPRGRHGLSARRMAVLSPFRAPSLCRHVHHELLRSVLLDVTLKIPATACHQSNDVERYRRSNFEHNYGHGEQQLSVVFAMLMMLAFLVDQIQQLCCALFHAVWAKLGSKRLLWERMRALFYDYALTSMRQLFEALLYGFQKSSPLVTLDSS